MTAKASVLFTVLLLSALGATVGSAASGDPKIASQEPVRPQRVVCRREAVTGSHFKRRVCRTESQIHQDRVEARDELERMQAFRDAEIRMESINQGR
jgi:predicted secreted protein